jgi:hypothetical protein
MQEAAVMQNSDFLAEVSGHLADDEYLWVCNFRASPEQGEWGGRSYRGTERQAQLIDDAGSSDNTYFSVSLLSGFTESGQWARQKGTFKRLLALVVDDVDPSKILGYSWALQTSPGKWQVGILLDRDDPDCANLDLVDRVMNRLSAQGQLGNDKSGNAIVRYVRLPIGVNTKARAAGPWRHQLADWFPQTRWNLADACEAVGIDLDSVRESVTLSKNNTALKSHASTGSVAGEALQMMSAPLGERSYHDAIVRMAASLVAGGMFPGAAVDFLYSLMDQVRPSGPAEELARWSARRAEIPRAVKSAEKFAPPERGPAVNVTLRVGADSPSADAPGELLLSLPELERRSAAVRWQVKHVIPADSIGMLFGASGTFKSFVALDHALHVAHGLQWLGRKTKQGSVVYVAAEGGAGIYRRVAAWHQERGLGICESFRVCITPLVLSLSEQVELLAAAIEALPEKPSLVYVDTLSQTFEGDENSATDIAGYLRLLNAGIRARFHCTVIVIHHSGHAATERPRGSSAITANVDFMLGAYRPDAGALLARLDFLKQKDGDRLGSQGFELKRVVLGQDEDGEEYSSLVACWNDAAQKVLAAHAVKVAGHEKTLLGLLEAAGGQAPEAALRHAFYDAVARECREQGKPYNQETAKKALQRAHTALNGKSLIALGSDSIVRRLGI